MLRELRIRNVAIIDELRLSFREGLNVITGETGAGKSVLLRSLALLCGGRATADLVRSDTAEATVEAIFDFALPADLREALGLEDDDELLVRRQIGANGKGRIFINGNPATVSMLARLGEHLVHIYGQHDQALLLRPSSHLELLDQFAELRTDGERMRAAFGAYVAARQRLDEIDERARSLRERRDLLEFQRDELRQAAVQPGEESDLRQQRERLRHAGQILNVCRAGEQALYSGDDAVLDRLARLDGDLQALLDAVPELASPAELLESGRLQIEEAALQLRAVAEHTQADPGRLEEIDDRLALISRLSRKFGVESSALPETLAGLETDLTSIDDAAAERGRAAELVAARSEEALQIAHDLSVRRRAAATRLEERMGGELEALGMAGAVFRVDIDTAPGNDTESLSASGRDRVEFALAANRGEEPKPLARVASGGELSRIMLALKALTASVSETPILIFDEVDAGVGGAVADAVARRLRALAETRQLLCITHLPQIAAYANHHLAVAKSSRAGRAVSATRALDGDERVDELTRMLGGEVAPDEAQRYARQLLAQARGDRARRPSRRRSSP
jgi:DNA repair protein RecN (Recombination protein N)